MARKNFLKQAQQSIVDSQTLIAEEPIQEDYIVGSKRSEYEGTTRLKGARNIPLNKIKPDPNQPRTTFNEESLTELANSIKQHGVLEPITVEYVQTEDYFKIISGERRYRASQLAELGQGFFIESCARLGEGKGRSGRNSMGKSTRHHFDK